MIHIKSKDELKIMQELGSSLAKTRDALVKYARPGISLNQIEDKAQQMIAKAGAKPAFARVPGYNWATCLNVNDGFVHGVPNDYVLRSSDILSIDIGMYKHGFNTDTACTFALDSSQISNDDKKFLKTGQKTLESSFKLIKDGLRLGLLSQHIQKEIEAAGYSVARNLTGHGIGQNLHEEPKIPCFVNQPIQSTIELKSGMTIAVEILYLKGSAETKLADDGWTIKSKDGKITGIFEKTIAISADGCIVLT